MVESKGQQEMEPFTDNDQENPCLAPGGKDDRRCPEFSYRCRIISVFILAVLIASVVANIILGEKLKHYETALGAKKNDSLCSQNWVKRETTADSYYFSVVEGDWEYSLKNCTSCGGSLVIIEDQQEMDFLMRNKGLAEYWLGLQRENLKQSWKTPNGTVFKNWYIIKGEGLCAYLNSQMASSTWCSNNRYWICKKRGTSHELRMLK